MHWSPCARPRDTVDGDRAPSVTTGHVRRLNPYPLRDVIEEAKLTCFSSPSQRCFLFVLALSAKPPPPLPATSSMATLSTTASTIHRPGRREVDELPIVATLLPEPLSAAQSRPQATPRHHCHREVPPRRLAPPSMEPPHRRHREHRLCSELLSEPQARRHHHRTTLSTPFPSGRPPTTVEQLPR
jgi:hypothetical protein